MYVAVDVGGTKTLVAVFDDNGQITEEQKFPTSQNYDQFKKDLAGVVAKFTTSSFSRGVAAIPGRLDRETGKALGYGTLKWDPEPVQADLQNILGCPIAIENDAKLAGLYEARQVPQYKDVLYVTVGTGISCALVNSGQLNSAMADSEGGQLLVDLDGKTLQWEDVVSGRAIVERFGKKASEITDENTWKQIAHDLAMGILDLISVIQPDVVVMGGGVSTNFDKFGPYLTQYLKEHASELVPIPPIQAAKRPEEAVIYGCYELAKSASS